jgi:hypothetical protein
MTNTKCAIYKAETLYSVSSLTRHFIGWDEKTFVLEKKIEI